MTKSPIAVAAAIALAAPAMAQANVRWFHSPSGNIQCEVAYHDQRGSYAYCQTFKPLASVRLHLNGHSTVCHGSRCVGDGPQDAITLRYGHTLHIGAFTCTSSTHGIRCTVGKHGFLIGRSGIQRF